MWWRDCKLKKRVFLIEKYVNKRGKKHELTIIKVQKKNRQTNKTTPSHLLILLSLPFPSFPFRQPAPAPSRFPQFHKLTSSNLLQCQKSNFQRIKSKSRFRIIHLNCGCRNEHNDCEKGWGIMGGMYVAVLYFVKHSKKKPILPITLSPPLPVLLPNPSHKPLPPLSLPWSPANVKVLYIREKRASFWKGAKTFTRFESGKGGGCCEVDGEDGRREDGREGLVGRFNGQEGWGGWMWGGL